MYPFFILLLIVTYSGLTILLGRFDSLCSPPVQFGVEGSDHSTHFRFEVRTFRIVARHLDSFLAKGVCNCTFVTSALSQYHGHGMA